jgi:hypothetical protein
VRKSRLDAIASQVHSRSQSPAGTFAPKSYLSLRYLFGKRFTMLLSHKEEKSITS